MCRRDETCLEIGRDTELSVTPFKSFMVYEGYHMFVIVMYQIREGLVKRFLTYFVLKKSCHRVYYVSGESIYIMVYNKGKPSESINKLDGLWLKLHIYIIQN